MPALVSASRPRHASSGGDDQTETSPNGKPSPSSWSPRTILATDHQAGGQEDGDETESPEPVAAANRTDEEQQRVTTTATSAAKTLPHRLCEGVSGWETVIASPERTSGTAAAASVGGRVSRPSSPFSRAGQQDIVRGDAGKNVMWTKDQEAIEGRLRKRDMKGVMLPQEETEGVVVKMEQVEVERAGVRNLGVGDMAEHGDGERKRETHEGWESSAAEAEWDSELDHDNTRQWEPDRQDSKSDSQWVREARLVTGRMLPGSQRRPSEPKMFTHQEMPRDSSRASIKWEAMESAASSGCATEDEGSRHDSGGDGRGGGKGSVDGGGRDGDGSGRRRKQKRDKQRNKAKNNQNRRNDAENKSNGGGGYGLNGGLSLANLTSMGASPSESSARGGSTFKDANVLSSSMPLLSTDSGNDDTDATGTDADGDAGALAAAVGNGPEGVERSSSMRPPTSGKTAPTTPRRISRRPGGGQGGAGRRGREASPALLTYVTHERPAAAEDDQTCRAGADSVTEPLSSRRFKRRRPPRLQVGSGRAVVWGEQCPACRRREFRDGDAAHEGEETAALITGASCDSCVGARGNGEAGEGPVRPGQYVYLRAAPSEDVRRSLVSEGEFAAPRPGGLSGSDLAGARIRVWRKSGAGVGGSGGSGDAGGNGSGGGSYAEADVVQFNPVDGKHRLRFVKDGAVEDVSLMKPIESGGDGGGQGGGGVRWLQRRTRARARDAVQRNSAGLCEGPAGEVRGLIGDEHDPAAQRRENWRWAVSRWRWDLLERDGYVAGGRTAREKGVGGGGNSEERDDSDRNMCDRAGVPLAGDGMFPPIGRVLALERRYVGTGQKVVDAKGISGRGGDSEVEPTEFFLKVKRLWYPQDTLCGMDPFVHGKAEVFEACQVVNNSPNFGVGERVDVAPPSGGVEACLCASDRSYSTQQTAAGNGKGGPGLEGFACTGQFSVGVDGGASVGAACRLDAGQRLESHPKLEPVILWVRACEAKRLASVHPCLDGRLNPCSGKVVNDPHQPQAEFFLSHRYCLELDAYFPLEEEGKGPGSASNSGSGGDSGPSSPRTGEDGGRHPSPRSTKARLLNRGVSDGMLDLPAKWHPLKKRMSLDQATTATGNGGGGGGRDSPVIGWESAVGRSGWSESTRGSVGVTTAFASVSSGGSGFAGRALDEIFLCHRCRHALPSRRLRKCRGRGCDNQFCAPCVAERSWSGCGGRGSPRGARWPGASRESFSKGTKYSKGADETDGVGTGCETPKPWTGPCCQGRCGCRECIAGEGDGLLSSWRARNGLPSMATVAQQPMVLRPARLCKTSTPKARASFEWSGWQGRPKAASVGREAYNGSTAGGNGTELGARDAATTALGSTAEAGACNVVEDELRAIEDDLDIRIEWCRSCSGPSPTGSLARCYYCNGGVHASGCRRFEEALISRRLAEYGVGSSGQIVSPPTGDGAVGHGVAVCVRRRWRAGLVLCWSPALRAHYVRYVDGSPEQGATATTDLDAIPWDGEWVVLPEPLDETVLPNGKPAAAAAAVAAAADRSGDSHRSATAVLGSAVRWPLVEVVLRLHPVPSPPSSSVPTVAAAASASGFSPIGSTKSSPPPLSPPRPPPSRPPPPPESRPATKVLKALLKQTWLASQAASTERGLGQHAGGPQKYCPPAVALPSSIPELHGGGSGNEPIKAGTRPWVCHRCVEAKLQRLQRRVRSQFQAPQEVERSAEEVSVRPPSDATRSAPGQANQTMSPLAAPAPTVTSKFAGWLRPQPATADAGRSTPTPSLGNGEILVHNGISEGTDDRDRDCLRDGTRELDGPAPKKEPSGTAGSQPKLEGPGGSAEDTTEGVAPPSTEAITLDAGTDATAQAQEQAQEQAQAQMQVAAEAEAASTDREKECQDQLRRAQGNRRLRWLSAGNPGSTRPFAYEAGFLSDVSDIHAHGGLTASGTTVGTSKRSGSRGRKRPRAPPVTRAFSHLLAGLGAQCPLAFSLPADVTRLDGDMASFFSAGGEADTGSGGDGGVGLFDEAVRGGRSVVLVDGTAAAVAAAAAAVVVGGIAAGVAAVSGTSTVTVKLEGAGGAGAEGATGSGGAAAAAFVRVPAGFSSVQEVDLESSARIRPLDTSKHRKLRSSGSGGGVRNASRSLRMCSGEAFASVAEDSPAGDGPAGGSTTTLKDVSRKDRMQRMDQRRMRRQGQELVEAGLLNLDVLQSRRKKLRFGRSSVHAWGVFADEPIAAGDLVIEYRGEIIGNAVADKREKLYEDMQIGSDYMFRVDEDTVVDATFKGSLARFINHSCDPSCTTRIIVVEGSNKIVIYAERDVEMGEELSYDYKFPLEPDEAARVPCRCGSEKCRGFIN